MNANLLKMLLRSIRTTFGRYVAILAIVALGVGFFAGLKSSEPAMSNTADAYLREQRMYDFQLMSTLGITDEDVEAFKALDYISHAEGIYSLDVLVDEENEKEAYKFLSLGDEVCVPVLLEGRMPEKSGECLADSLVFDASHIGSKLIVSSSNEEENLDMLTHDAYTIVGIAKIPRYISAERGSTHLGSGNIKGFVLLPDGAFDSEAYHELLLISSKLTQKAFTEEYDAVRDNVEKEVKTFFNKRGALRYKELRAEADEELGDARKELDEGWQEYEDGEKEGREELHDAAAELYAAQIKLDKGWAELENYQKQLDDGFAQISQKREELNSYLANPMLPPAYKDMIVQGLEELEANYNSLLSQQAQIDSSREELAFAQWKIDDGWLQYHDGKKELEEELADALKELEDGEQEYLDAVKEVEEELQLELFTLTRDENSGCATFKNDVSIVDAIADVFPVFFALIAALVCSTTMTRMVTEERTQIGTLKALGYSSRSIMSKYLMYSGSSAFLGCIMGFALGVTAIPYIVWSAYGILYDYASLQFYYSIEMCLACIAVAVLGILIVTWYACRRELSAKPAELIRPKVEGKGKRVFVEYITPLWKRLSFLNKVTVRNALRYKSRVFMMLLGIGGCTALLVTGFGVRDSVVNVLGDQYEKIFLYDLSVKYEPEDFESQAEAEKLWKDKGSYAMSYQTEATLTNTVAEKTAQLVAAEPGALEGMIELFNDDGRIAYPEAGQAVLTTRVSEQLEVEPGDSIHVSSDDGLDKELVVSGICENYVGNYIYVLPETANNEENNTAIVRVNEGVDAAALGARLRSEEGISYVSIMEQEKEMMADSMASLDMVVLLLIVCSGALAFITLYNLTNINLLERIREVATVKVLGFYHKETASYILRENVMLSFLGAAVGMFMGKIFHRFIIGMLQVEGMRFGDEIAPLSFILGFAMTIFFAWLCNLSMHGKLKKVNMTESLKSVE